MQYFERRQMYMIMGGSTAAAIFIVVVALTQGIYVPESPYFVPMGRLPNTIMAVALIVALFPPSIAGYFNLRYRITVERNIPRLMRGVMDDVQAGVTLTKALVKASTRDYGPVSDAIGKSMSKFILGRRFDEAMMEMAEELHHPQAKQMATILIEGHLSGGKLSEVLRTAVEMYSEFNEYMEERRAKMKPYTYLIYMAVLIFLVVAYISINQFLVPLQEASGTPLFRGMLKLDYYASIFFWSSLIESLFGGFVGGKVAEGSIKAGAISSNALMILSVVFFNIAVF